MVIIGYQTLTMYINFDALLLFCKVINVKQTKINKLCLFLGFQIFLAPC